LETFYASSLFEGFVVCFVFWLLLLGVWGFLVAAATAAATSPAVLSCWESSEATSSTNRKLLSTGYPTYTQF
jgi:hypothetical protein